MSTKNSISKTESSQELLNIKKLINFRDLFREYYPELYRENGHSLNPFIPDTIPSYYLYDDRGVDYGDDKKKNDIYDLHQLRFGCSKGEAIRALKARANGGIVTVPPITKSVAPPSTDKSKEGFKPWKDGKLVATYDYTDETGKILYQNLKYIPKDPSKWPKNYKTCRPRRPNPNSPGKWIGNLEDTRRVPFGLPELLAAPKDQLVHVCEGEKDTLAMREVGFVATSVGTATTGHSNLVKHNIVDYFSDRHVILVADKDEDGRKYVEKVAPVYAAVAASVKIIEMPGDGIKDCADLVESQGIKSREIIEGIVNSTKEYAPGIATANKVTELKNDDSTSTEGSKKKKSKDLNKFQKLNICFNGLGWKLFFDESSIPWASVKIGEHYENIRVDTRKFRRLVRKEFMAEFDDGIGFDTIEQVIDAQLGGIEYSQAQRRLHVRMCWNAAKDKILIDSGNPDWDVIEIGPDGWQIIQTDENPFKRAPKTAAYSCTPETPRASWDNVFEFIRVKNDIQKTIIKMWLCLALFPDTSRPGLVVNGPYGSGKSTIINNLKIIVDPATTKKPNKLANKVDDMIAPLSQYAVTAFDNENTFTQEHSDMLCRCIDGFDPSKRALFTDGEIYSTELMITWVLAGINRPGQMGDFLSRTFLIETELLNKQHKIHHNKIEQLADKYRSGIQALIFDCIASALKQIKTVEAEKEDGKFDLHRLAQANLYSLGVCRT